MTRVIIWTLILCCISKDTICKSAHRRITTTRFDKRPNDLFYGQSQYTAFKTGLRIKDKSYSRNQPHHDFEYPVNKAVMSRPTAGFDKIFGGTSKFDEFYVGLRDMRDQAHRKRTRNRPFIPKRQNVTDHLDIKIERPLLPLSKYWQAKSFSKRPRSWHKSRAQIRTWSRHKNQEEKYSERTVSLGT